MRFTAILFVLVFACSLLADRRNVPCPYCGEMVELVVDPGGGVRQDYVEDCEVCCRPWRIRLTFQRDGSPVVDVATLNDT